MKTAKNIFVLLLILFSVWALLTPTIRVGGVERGGDKNLGMKLGLDLAGGTYVVMEADLTQLAPGQEPDDAMDGAKRIIEERIDEFGVAEATVQRQGGERIAVQLPGVRDVNQAIKLIGQTAQLDFRKQKLDETGQVVRDENGAVVWVPATGTMDDKDVHLTGAFLKPNSFVDLTPNTNQPIVHFEWNAEGAKLFEQITTELLNKPLGIFLDNKLVSDPVVRAVIEDKGIIEGIKLEEARLLRIQLNAGALPIPLKVVQQTDVDAFLGADSLKRSLQAGVVGLGLVMLFLISYYRLPGILATLALLYYGALVLTIFKLIPVTLTLAGIAGFIVSLGMAVDANILIFERMKEELRGGRTLRAAIDVGFSRAWPSIRDANITTFIACAVLYWFGSQFVAVQVMGFAVTLFIGVAVSMFTAITITRRLLRMGLSIAASPSLYRV
ncbi:MAG: protein translocase subunit SecD [Chloroflexota bacterium]